MALGAHMRPYSYIYCAPHRDGVLHSRYVHQKMRSKLNCITELFIVFMTVKHEVIKLGAELLYQHPLLEDLKICVRDT